ncbi:MAG: hypothetical protein HY931_00850 [Candidatus Falkowbacteria bacterium]|nr:MAG: hypothetical protein HY931_00850 [Candidatus Falkowbacteria bacterium]
MEKINFKKTLLPFFIILTLFVSAFSFASWSRAEDDDEEGERFWFLEREEREEDEGGGREEDENGYENEEWEPNSENITDTPVIINPVNETIDLAALIDSDQDGIIDSADKYPSEDDFAYLLLDKNKNGIGDDLEKILK